VLGAASGHHGWPVSWPGSIGERGGNQPANIALSILTFDGLDELLEDRNDDKLYANDLKS